MEEKEREATEAAPAVLTNEATGADEAEELLEVSAADAATLAGRGSAASPATMVEQRTGATVAVEKLSTKCQVRVQGNKASVAKALTLLRALVSFREAARPRSRAIAAGLPRASAASQWRARRAARMVFIP